MNPPDEMTEYIPPGHRVTGDDLKDAIAQAVLGAADARPQAPTVNAVLERITRLHQERARKLSLMLAQLTDQGKCELCGSFCQLNRERSIQTGQITYDCANCEETERQEIWRRRQTAAGIPTDVRHADLKNWNPGDPRPSSDHPSKFPEAARAVIGKSLRNLILAGPPGIGKGHIAASIANEMLRQGAMVRWRIVHRLFEAGHRAYEDNSREGLIEGHIRVHLLILDEIAMAEMPRDGERTLYDIIDGRHKAKRPTILLSNQPADPIKNWLGPAITDRLRSGGVKFLWGDWDSARGNRTKDHAF